MNTFNQVFLLICILCGVFSLSADVHAIGFIDQSARLDASPKLAVPNEKTELTLVSYDTDLDRATIKWYKDGKLEVSGIGETQYSFVNKGLGEKTTIRVVADKITFSQVFIPAEIDLLWEAVGAYTPPFYKGKALTSSEGRVKVVALPHMTSANGSPLQKEKMVFKWKKDEKYREFYGQSGYGKYYVEFDQDLLLNEETIKVEAFSYDETVEHSARTRIKKTLPEIILYEDDPLEGVQYQNAIGGDLFMKNKEVSLVAEPYYFSSKQRDGEKLVYEWKVNNKKVDAENSESRMIFGFEDGVEGKSKISLEVKHAKKILQFAKIKTLSLLRGESSAFLNTLY